MISFHATCCSMVFEGPQGAADFTQHMIGVHGKRLRKPGDDFWSHTDARVPAAHWAYAKPYTFKAHKPGTLPPPGVRRDMLNAARVS